jgi:four helix bundle protein
MARPKGFRDLIVWQKAMVLAKEAYSVTADMPGKEAYGLIHQIRRAAVSVPSNIAEGHGRLTDSQFRHFLGNARGSLYELQTQFELANNFGYVDLQVAQSLSEQASDVARLLNGLISSLHSHAYATSTATSANTASSAHRGA